MLQPIAPGPSVVVCSTCRASAEAREEMGEDGAIRRGGALLEAALHAVQAAEPELRGVAIQAMPCLFACTRHCAVHIRAPGKLGYVLGDFTPDQDAARAILEYAARHAASAEGQVPYREWPQGVKGHFITRTPPEGFVCT